MKEERLLKVSIAIIILSVAIVIVVNASLKLENPIFLENYCEYPLNYYEESKYNGSYCNQELTIKYITNANDKKTVREIELDGLPENSYSYASEYGPLANWMYYDTDELNETVYGLYSIRELNIELRIYLESQPLDNIVIDTATVYFSDGSKQQVDLGKIIFYYENGLDEGINFMGSSFSSDGDFTAYGEVLKDIEITKIYSPLFKYCQEYIDLFVSGTSYLELNNQQYKADNSIVFKGKFNKPEDIKDRYSIYEIAPKIYYINEGAEKWYARGNSISYKPADFKFLDIIKYLKVREEF